MAKFSNVKPIDFKVASIVSWCLWTLLILLVFVWHYFETKRSMLTVVRQIAMESTRKDLLYRRWAAGHGGVYVPVTDTTRSNPYLVDIKERDISTPSGRQLTLVNPAYMTRQVYELAASQGEETSHLVSLNPRNPKNAPDAWETEALRSIESGSGEVFSLATVNGAEMYRLLQPMRIEASCLKCHAAQGYRLGDLRGGISVAVPMKTYRTLIREETVFDAERISIVWLVGLIAISSTLQLLRRRMDERQQAIDALGESEERWRSIVEHEPECVKLLDREGRLLEMNPAGLAMIQAGSVDVKGERAVALVVEKDRPAFEEMVAAVFRGETRRIVFDMVGLKGRHLTLETTSVPLWDPADSTKVKALLGVTRDITERKQLEEQLRQAQRMEAIGLLAGGVAHDFNNLLQAISTFGFLMRMQLEENALPVQFAEEQHVVIKRASELTEALLSFSRRQIMNPKPHDLNLIVRDARKLLRRLIREDIVIEVSPAPGALTVWVDEGQIHQVLMNLATNACDAMPQGGKLSIATSRFDPDSAFVARHGCNASDPFALLACADTGIGMDEDTIGHIFEPFYTTKEVGHGTGLGLAITYGIVQQHQGIIEVDSASGEGTTFKIYLHLVDKEGTGQVKDMAVHSRQGNETILLVEDEEKVRLAVRTVLTRFNYRVLEATDGEEAVALFREHADTISLVIMDIVMPKKNGREAMEEIRQLAPETRVIFLTGYDAEHGEPKEGTENTEHILIKPVAPDTLLATIRTVLGDASD